MNRNFSLSYPMAEVLPEQIAVDGLAYPIRPDFRTILKIYRLFADPEIAERHKPMIACELFFDGKIPGGGYLALLQWLVPKEIQRDPNAPPMDFEFDADVIYASFLQQYRIDLLRVRKLHWYAFLTLLGGLNGDTPLSARLYARGRDTSKLKGKDKQSAEIAKRNAQIPQRASRNDRQLHDRLAQALMNGEDVGAILAQIGQSEAGSASFL